MNNKRTGNALMVSNYTSDVGYAWWLMEHFWKTLAERFTQAGNSAYLAYPKITSLSETIKNAPIKPLELNLPWQSLGEAKDALRLIKKENITSLYFTDQPYFSYKYAILRLFGVRHIIIHDHTPGDRPPVGGIRGTLKSIRNALPWFTADYVFCVSDLMQKRNLTNARLPLSKCVTVQNGIPPIVRAPTKNLKLRKKLGLAEHAFVITTTGRAHPYKRFHFVINCAARLKASFPDLEAAFLLVGDGPAMLELQQQVKELGLTDSVHLLGFRDDIHELLCISDLALHAALGEGFSLSIIEYMSAGLPVLVPDIPSVSQAIEHGKTGIVYPTNSEEGVANAIHSLAIDENRRKKMGSAAKSKADSKYSLAECTKDFIVAIDTGFKINT